MKKLPLIKTTSKLNVPALVAQSLPAVLETGRDVVQSLNRRAEKVNQANVQLSLMAADREMVRELQDFLVDSRETLNAEQQGQLVTAMVHVAVHGSRRLENP